MKDTWQQREAKRKAQREAKKRETRLLVASIDKLIDRAVESDAYHEGEVEKLNTARSAVFAVHAGYVKRVRR